MPWKVDRLRTGIKKNDESSVELLSFHRFFAILAIVRVGLLPVQSG